MIQACAVLSHIVLTPLEPTDVGVIEHLGRHYETFEHIPQIDQPFDAKTWCAKAIGSQENYIRHVIRVGSQRTPTGYVQICRRANLDLELGYWLGKDYWGYGIAPAAALAAMSLFFCAGGQPRIFAATTPSNTASRRVLAKLGFVETNLSNAPEGMIDHIWTPSECVL